MEETIRQVGELLLGAIPTMVLLVLLWLFYSLLVHRPLTRVLAERRARTQGAIEKARADTQEAEARTAQYEHRLREARMAAFKAQEARRKQVLEARMAAIEAARAKGQDRVAQAKAAIEGDKVSAQAILQAESSRLAAEIVRTVLSSTASQPPASGR
jgi:F-type H+-transporting ATPase subunit b